MASYRIISSDSHVFEPPDLWTSRVDPKFRDRAPNLVREEDGEWWYCDGKNIFGLGAGSQPGVRFEEPETLSPANTFENVRPGGYIPEEHVKDMRADGVDAGVIYPSVGLGLYRSVKDSDLLSAVFSAYNDWLAEFCNAYPKQLRGIAMLNIDDVGPGVKELERCANMGFAGAMITTYPAQGHSYDLPQYEPLWAAAQDLEMPLSLHFRTNRPGPEASFSDIRNQSDLANSDHYVRMSLADMIFSGVFEHYPKLQVGSVELELSWVPHFLDRLDYTYTQRAQRESWHRFEEDMLPSDYFRRNVFVGFQEDALGISPNPPKDVLGDSH